MFLASKVAISGNTLFVSWSPIGILATNGLPVAAILQILPCDWYFVNSLLGLLQPKYCGNSHCLLILVYVPRLKDYKLLYLPWRTQGIRLRSFSVVCRPTKRLHKLVIQWIDA